MAFPKGIRNRSTPDWHARYLSQVGYWADFDGEPDGVANLYFYNNASDGSSLWIFGMIAGCDGALSMNIVGVANGFFNQIPNGSVPAFALPTRINATLPMPPGVIYADVAVGFPVLRPQVRQIGYIPGPQFETNMLSDSPLYIVPAGWSFVFDTQGTALVAWMQLWYIPFLDSGGFTPR